MECFTWSRATQSLFCLSVSVSFLYHSLFITCPDDSNFGPDAPSIVSVPRVLPARAIPAAIILYLLVLFLRHPENIRRIFHSYSKTLSLTAFDPTPDLTSKTEDGVHTIHLFFQRMRLSTSCVGALHPYLQTDLCPPSRLNKRPRILKSSANGNLCFHPSFR